MLKKLNLTIRYITIVFINYYLCIFMFIFINYYSIIILCNIYFKIIIISSILICLFSIIDHVINV